MVKKVVAALFSLVVVSSLLAGCNTTRGIGEDVQQGGSAISNAADRAQN